MESSAGVRLSDAGERLELVCETRFTRHAGKDILCCSTRAIFVVLIQCKKGEVMFIDDCELKLNGVCSQNNMRDCADSVQRNRIDGCRFLVSSLSWSNLHFWSILTNIFFLQTSAKSNQC